MLLLRETTLPLPVPFPLLPAVFPKITPPSATCLWTLLQGTPPHSRRAGERPAGGQGRESPVIGVTEEASRRKFHLNWTLKDKQPGAEQGTLSWQLH